MDNAFGKRLKILRKEHHITQVQLAERMDQTESNIRNYELGKAFPRIPGLMFLSKMFGVSTDFLLGLSDVRDGNRMGKPEAPVQTSIQDFSTDELLAELKRRWNDYD